MADTAFEISLRRVLAIERLYSNDPADTGGETVWGISRRNWPKWEGWAIVDRARAKGNFPESLRADATLSAAVVRFYRAEFWVRVRCDQMPDVLADKIFELAVNAGIRPAGELLQVALTSLGHPVTIDGVIGPATIAAAGAIAPAAIRTAVQGVQAGYYLGIVAAKPSQRRFRNGWLARAFT